MKSCVPYGKYILVVFVMGKIQEIVVFLMVNSMCSLCRIRCGNFFVFVVDGVPFRSIEFVPLFDTLKITEKVLFTITSEASYVGIWSRQKFIKNVFENLKLAVKQCYPTGHFQ